MRAHTGLLRILVVDDDPALRWYVRQCLLPMAGEVIEASDEVTALAAAREVSDRGLDLVVADVVTPGSDGTALAEALQAEARLEGVPVLFLTASARVPPHLRPLVLRKPFNASMLRAKVTALLEGRLRPVEAGRGAPAGRQKPRSSVARRTRSTAIE